jgi:hypothetical protein
MPSFVVSRGMRGVFGAGRVTFALLGTAGAAGCSSNSTAPVAAAEAQGPVCPATPGETVGQACATEGLVCAPLYTCGVAQAVLSCVCRGGKFQCSDGAGNAIDPSGDVQPCPGPAGGPTGVCPPSEGAANLAPCKTPGQICAYPAVCPGVYDQCYCFPGETARGGFGIVFSCERAVCAGDAGTPTLPEEAGSGGGPDSSLPPPGDASAEPTGHASDADQSGHG